MNIVSRSSAAGNSIMPPTANMVSGNTSVWIEPGLGGHLLGHAAGHRGGVGGEGVQCDCAGRGFDRRAPFGDQQHAQHADQQDRALQEQRGPVDGDRADHRRGPEAAAERRGPVRRPRSKAATSAGQAQRDLGGVAAPARCERFDEHADDGGAEDDQHRRQQAVVDAGAEFIGRAPCATVGVGSRVWWIEVRVAVDGRVDHVQRHLRVDPEHEQQGDQRRHHEQFARPQIPHRLVALGDRAGHHPLVHPQHVERREHQRERRRTPRTPGSG